MVAPGVYTIESADRLLLVGIHPNDVGRKKPNLRLCDSKTDPKLVQWLIKDAGDGFVTVALASDPKKLWEDAWGSEWLNLDEPDKDPHEQHWKFELQTDGSYAIAHRDTRRHVSSEPADTVVSPPSSGVGQWVYLRPTSGARASGRWKVKAGT